MFPVIVTAYAALLAFIYIFLSSRVIQSRVVTRIGLGTGGNRGLERRMRIHANFAEYVPLSLLLISFVEMSGASALMVYFLGLCLLVGRAVHAYGVSRLNENYAFRVAGMAMTFTTLMGASGYLILSYAKHVGS